MRFSLRFLLFIAPCILVAAYFVIWHVQGYLDSLIVNRYRAWLGVHWDIENLSELSHHASKLKMQSVEQGTIDLNLWFKGELSNQSPAAQLMNELHLPKEDCFGHTFIAVGLGENNQPAQDPAKAIVIGIYSTGIDGVSNSNGSDPDDISSWRIESSFSYYERLKKERYWQSRKIRAFVALVVGTFSVLALWMIGLVGYRMLFKKA